MLMRTYKPGRYTKTDSNHGIVGPKLIEWETRPWDSDTYDCDEESEC